MTTSVSQPHHESNRTFYDRISQAYDLIADAGEHKAREAGETLLDLQPGESVLELGFGTGNSLIRFSNLVGAHGKVTGLDISPGMQQVAEAKIAKSETGSPIELTVGDARELPFEDGQFDAVFASLTLELFPLEDIPGVIQEVARVLKPTGRLGIVAMSIVRDGEKTSALEKAYVWMHRHFPHLVDCQPIDVPSFLENSPLQCSVSNEVKIWTMPVAIVLARPRPSA